MIDFILRVHHKMNKKLFIPFLRKYRRKKLKYDNFTIISNNCWGGVCYDYFGLPKQSPTVGCYFFAEDYVNFCKNLKFYLSLPLEIIPLQLSKHYSSIIELHNENAIIGVLGDVEIIFLHYHDPKTILDKWNRRISRINWDKIILKFSYQNECSDSLIKEFLAIKDYPKFVLTGEKISESKDEILYKRSKGKNTIRETENFGLFVNPIWLLNERL